jgi:hypothetical protein
MMQAKVKLEMRYGIGWRIVRSVATALARVGIIIPAPVLAWAASRSVQVRVADGRWMKLRATTRGGR